MPKRVITVLLFALLPLSAAAQSGLFQARIAVSDQSDSARAEAARDGLEQVLERLTGRPDIADDEALSELLDSPERYVQRFGYERDDDGEAELRLRYDGPAIQDALIQAEIPVWPASERPRMLTWVVIDESGQRRILSSEDHPELREALSEAAAQQGLSLLFPLMDIEDQQAVTASDLWGNFADPIRAASERYDPRAILVGRLDRRGGDWRGRWSLYRDDEVRDWRASDADMQAALEAGMTSGARTLAQAYARVPDADDVARLVIRVRGIDELAAYGEVASELEGMENVAGVDPVRLGDDSVDFRLQIQGLSEGVLERLRSDRLLVEADESEPAETAERAPDYTFDLR
ncbi:MAG: DUF2066 domain-containing protein [Ectothiorhodospiraceae bacterium]